VNECKEQTEGSCGWASEVCGLGARRPVSAASSQVPSPSSPPKWLRLRPLLLPPSSPLWPTLTTDSPNGGLLSDSPTREPWRTSQKRSSVSCGSYTTRLPALPFPRGVSFHVLHARISCNPRLNTLLQPPTSQTSSSTAPGPTSRKTSRFCRCSKSPTHSRWPHRQHLRRTTSGPCLRTTRLSVP